MKHPYGLVSISFREKSPEELVAAMTRCGLTHIEWGSDVHAPVADEGRLRELAALCRRNGITVSSYGTYFRIGDNRPLELVPYIRAARLLGTHILRLWCGTKGYARYSADELAALLADCRVIAALAEENGVTVCMECHNHTVTDCPEGAAALMQAVDSGHFRMYWQPNQYRTAEENRRYAAYIAPYTEILHVFHWVGDERFPLAEGAADWQAYLRCFPAGIPLLLEFMPDDRLETLERETRTLREIAEKTE